MNVRVLVGVVVAVHRGMSVLLILIVLCCLVLIVLCYLVLVLVLVTRRYNESMILVLFLCCMITHRLLSDVDRHHLWWPDVRKRRNLYVEREPAGQELVWVRADAGVVNVDERDVACITNMLGA